MNPRILTTFSVAALALVSAQAFAAQTVLWSQRFTVDSDGDGVVDLLDNAPGTANPFQEDIDNDAIGDAIDPTPSTSVPNLGDPGLGMNGPFPLPAGSAAPFDYLMVNAVPPGAFGHIDIDFGGNGVYDATFFGPLTASFLQFSIPANFFTDPLWNLNVPGAYTLHAKAYGPGMSSQNVTINDFTVIAPEPTAAALLLVGAASLGSVARRRRTRRQRAS